ncbi:MAG: hypothetical protein K9W44_06870 [Candidatus Lokiarchaeota archaeon]|nr:hypothetical protein [Candidatus Harpocratesius repetitus]
MVLLYPISPYIEKSDIITGFLPSISGGIGGLISLCLYVDKDIKTRKSKGKSLWKLRNDSIKFMEKIFCI